MAVEHVDIADGERHEPKGAATAANESVYVSDGAASGAWAWQPQYIVLPITDISTAQNIHFSLPFAGTIDKIDVTIASAIANTDSVVTPNISGTAITDGAVTVAFTGSAEGDIFTATPSALNIFASTDYIELANNGGSDNTVAATVTITYTRTA